MSFYYYCFIPLLTAACLFLGDLLAQGPDVSIRRIQAQLIIKDFSSAYEEAKQALISYPDSALIHEGYIKSLAYLGREKEMLKAWDTYVGLFPHKQTNRELIEEMCWGILNKASNSNALLTRLMALLAAYFSQDARGVDILYQGLLDPNSAIRSVSVQLASHLFDAKLLDQIKRLFKEEKAWIVRQQVIKAVGQMRIVSLRSELENLIGSNQSLAEEKALAIEALIELLDEIKREEIERLTFSNRAGLRLLACEAIAHFHSLRDQDCLFALAEDHHADVRAAALQALGLLHSSEKKNDIMILARKSCQDTSPRVAISAAWLLTLYAPVEGQTIFAEILKADRRDIRILAASAISATGRYGADLAMRWLEKHEDPYVRLNLALGLVGQRLLIEQAANVLEEGLTTEKEKWIWAKQGIFRALTPRSIKRLESESESIASTPEMENQLIRLEILNILAILQSPTAQEAVRRFLMERTWGVSGVAAALLLTEGDESAINLVQDLLKDSNSKIRLQAALILSLWGREESAINVLEQGYGSADKELKEKILEGLGRIGSMSSIPFLIQALKEPSQTLRIIAAMALIQCLNH